MRTNVRNRNQGTRFYIIESRWRISDFKSIFREESDFIFYPKDNTPGCTKQACGFAQLYPDFNEKGAVILGVSKDSVKSHKKFQEKYQLPFTLLSDPELQVIQAYDVWKEKNMYGKKVMGVVRTTYLINEEGIIEKAYTKVKAAQNPEDMLEVLNASQ